MSLDNCIIYKKLTIKHKIMQYKLGFVDYFSYICICWM